MECFPGRAVSPATRAERDVALLTGGRLFMAVVLACVAISAVLYLPFFKSHVGSAL